MNNYNTKIVNQKYNLKIFWDQKYGKYYVGLSFFEIKNIESILFWTIFEPKT